MELERRKSLVVICFLLLAILSLTYSRPLPQDSQRLQLFRRILRHNPSSSPNRNLPREFQENELPSINLYTTNSSNSFNKNAFNNFNNSMVVRVVVTSSSSSSSSEQNNNPHGFAFFPFSSTTQRPTTMPTLTSTSTSWEEFTSFSPQRTTKIVRKIRNKSPPPPEEETSTPEDIFSVFYRAFAQHGSQRQRHIETPSLFSNTKTTRMVASDSKNVERFQIYQQRPASTSPKNNFIFSSNRPTTIASTQVSNAKIVVTHSKSVSSPTTVISSSRSNGPVMTSAKTYVIRNRPVFNQQTTTTVKPEPRAEALVQNDSQRQNISSFLSTFRRIGNSDNPNTISTSTSVSTSPKIWQEPEKIWGEQSKVWGEPAKVWGEPEKIWWVPDKPSTSTTTTAAPLTTRRSWSPYQSYRASKAKQSSTTTEIPQEFSFQSRKIHPKSKGLIQPTELQGPKIYEIQRKTTVTGPKTIVTVERTEESNDEDNKGTFFELGEDDEEEPIELRLNPNSNVVKTVVSTTSSTKGQRQFNNSAITQHSWELPEITPQVDHTFIDNMSQGAETIERQKTAAVVSQSHSHSVVSSKLGAADRLLSTDDNSQLNAKEREKNGKKFGYVLEGSDVKKYRVEERTPDGYIVGEYGVINSDNGFLRGVRYTADGTINPRLIHEALMKFLSL